MAVQRLPSFWDYLGQGINNFSTARKEREDRENQKKQQERDNKMRELSFMSSLYGAGALPSGSFQEAINSSGVMSKPVTIQPSQAERKQQILNRPDIQLPSLGGMGMPGTRIKGSVTATDDEREAAGMSSTGEITARNLGNRRMQQSMVETEQDRVNKTRQAKDTQLGEAAGRFIPMAINKVPNALKNPSAVASAAFENYRAMLAKSSFGGLAPADEEYARSFFEKAAREAVLEERKLRVSEAVASGRATMQDREFDQLVRYRESTRKELDDLEQNSKFGPIISMYRGQPLEAIPASFQGIVKAHMERQTALQQIDARLNALAGITTGRPTTPIPSQQSVAQDATNPKVQKMANDLKSGALSVQNLDEAVKAKVITQAEADAAMKAAGKKRENPRARPTDTTASRR